MSLDYQSIIRTISSSISANNAAKVKIEERSKLFMGLATEPDGEDSADDNPQRAQNEADYKDFWHFGGVRFNRDSMLPVTRFLWRLFVAAGRFLYAFVVYIILGFIPLMLQLCGVKIFKTTPKYLSRSRRYNFFLFVVMVVGFVLLLVSLVAYFLRDVIFFPKNGYSTRFGAVVMEQPFASTNYLYLFNSAIPWSNTGIEVLEGDEITFSASGGFSNDMRFQRKSAETNRRDSLFQYINPTYSEYSDAFPTSDLLGKMRLYPTSDTASRYGAFLYRIAPETGGGVDDTITPIHQLRPVHDGTTIKADRDGMIRVSINDVYFTEPVLKMLFESGDTVRNAVMEILNLALPPSCVGDSAQTRDFLAKNPNFWFDDNNGEILLNIKVRRNPLAQSDKTTPNKILGCIFGEIDRLSWKAILVGLGFMCLLLGTFLMADFALGCWLRYGRKPSRK